MEISHPTSSNQLTNKQFLQIIEESSYGINLASQIMYDNGLGLNLLNPAFMIEQKYKNLDVVRADTPKIPFILHNIWLTHPTAPREIRPQDLKIAIDNRKLFDQAPVKWQHIVWVNDKKLLHLSVSALEKEGIVVKSIYDYQNSLSSFSIIETFIDKQKWGLASDTLRYSLIEHFGGVYADLNFKFNRDVTDEAYKYNFFTVTDTKGEIDNFFFGASPNHPILEKAVNGVANNFDQTIKDLDSKHNGILTDIGSAIPFNLAYFSKANKNGNIDVAYPFAEYSLEDNTEYYSTEIMQELEKNYFDYFIFIKFQNYISEHEICGANIYNIGVDSLDGNTWK